MTSVSMQGYGSLVNSPGFVVNISHSVQLA
jgi:hypothetical protein